MKYLKPFWIVFITLSVLLPIVTTPVYAEDFSIDVNIEYIVQDHSLLIRETHTITNNSESRYIPANQTMSFFFDKYEGRLTEEDNVLELQLETLQTSTATHTANKSDDYYEILLPFEKDLRSGQSQTFWIEYRDYQLSETVGSLQNIYLPKQAEQPDSEYSITKKFTVKIPSQQTEQMTHTMEPQQTSNDSTYTILTYTYDQLTEGSALIQIGTAQYYSFEITQDVPQTTNGNFFPDFPLNEVTLVLPREYDENNQQVYIKAITPEPAEIYTNSEGNTFARFLLTATSPHTIKIQGYISTSLSTSQNAIPENAPITEIPEEYNSQLNPSKYWEVDSQAVQNAIAEIPDSENVIEVINNTYEYVVTHLEYDKAKYQDNTRMGAEQTLKGGSAVCMEYADTMIALLRAQGVPARAAFGRGFNTNIPAEEQQDHQWVQAYVPSYGWMTIDPTWGENGYYYIGPDISRVLWYTSSIDPDSTPPLTHLSVENPTIDLPTVIFTPLEQPDLTNTVTLATYTELYTSDYNFWTKTYEQIRTTVISRIINQYFIHIVGIAAGFTFLLVLIEVISYFSRKALQHPTAVTVAANPILPTQQVPQAASQIPQTIQRYTTIRNANTPHENNENSSRQI